MWGDYEKIWIKTKAKNAPKDIVAITTFHQVISQNQFITVLRLLITNSTRETKRSVIIFAN